MIPRCDIINRAQTKASVPLFNRGPQELYAAAKRETQLMNRTGRSDLPEQKTEAVPPSEKSAPANEGLRGSSGEACSFSPCGSAPLSPGMKSAE